VFAFTAEKVYEFTSGKLTKFVLGKVSLKLCSGKICSLICPNSKQDIILESLQIEADVILNSHFYIFIYPIHVIYT
jgi:hypothetical protein